MIAALEVLSENEEAVLAFEAKLEAQGAANLGEEEFEITKGMASWKKGSRKVVEIKYTPSVIEPSFGKSRKARVLRCNLHRVFPYNAVVVIYFSYRLGSLVTESRSGSTPPMPPPGRCNK